MTTLDFDRCYRALQARDARFDGQFFVTVRTTGIYCRPSCPAQTPRPENVAFVTTAAGAQAGGFRACRRCLPDAVPGSPRWNLSRDLSARAMRLIVDGVIERDGVDGLASGLGYSTRHLTRVLTGELGAGPLALARAHRATNARILIQCTELRMSDIAFAAGFTSVRQFNDTIREVFGLTPRALRSLRRTNSRSDVESAAHPLPNPGQASGITLRLAYREPFDATWFGWYLGAHAVVGVESFHPDTHCQWRYQRVLSLPHGPALAEVTPGGGFLRARLDHLDLRDLSAAVSRLRRLFDLDADVVAATEALGADRFLGRIIGAAPGLRVPGSLDGGESLLRTMIGQQISVAAARHHVTRLVGALGEPTSWGGSWRQFPTAAAIAEHGDDVLTGPRRRIAAIVGAATAIAEHSVEPHVGVAASDLYAQLLALPGVGPWTADYVTMQVTGDPDVLLRHDLVVRHAARDLGIDLAATAHWAPWRSYASMHLWRHRLLPPTTTADVLGPANSGPGGNSPDRSTLCRTIL
ncbi:Ada metal-binding domain-containing protein [Gordonia sp. DT30]|uniref:Ada metal-binding domain-containing protein n=1 Tax=unclassified Gordonia (in: high G+C Gram-positive bacteria) TaxID=2657482 RepID=UPI003CEA8282